MNSGILDIDLWICQHMKVTSEKLDQIPLEDLEALRKAMYILVEIGI